MRQISKLVLLTLGFGLFAVALSWLPSHHAAAATPTPLGPPLPLAVTVTNTPLPVQGTVDANIAATPSSPLYIRDAGNPARQPFALNGTCSLSTGSPDCSAEFSLPGTATEKFVLETTTVIAFVHSGQKCRVTLDGFLGTVSLKHAIPVIFQVTDSTSSQDGFVGALTGRIILDGGSLISVFLDLDGVAAAPGALNVSISGYSVDCGAGTGCPIP